jgi:L-seryl-tRNA(Ser) seleniumtransferase
VGRRELLVKINRNPMKRALRVDKIRFAVLEATLRLYRDPDRLAQRLPTLRLLTRPQKTIETIAKRLKTVLEVRLKADFLVEVVECTSQIGSGALPLETVPSAGIAIRANKPRGAGRLLSKLAASFRQLAVPVIGRVEKQSLILDLRCLEDEPGFISNLDGLTLDGEETSREVRATY